MAHRFSYEMFVGPVPQQTELHHKCNHPWCVNPDHLESVTRKDHVHLGISKGALYAKRTHCQYGHEFNSDNTVWRGNSLGRKCLICKRIEGRFGYVRELNTVPGLIDLLTDVFSKFDRLRQDAIQDTAIRLHISQREWKRRLFKRRDEVLLEVIPKLRGMSNSETTKAIISNVVAKLMRYAIYPRKQRKSLRQ
jgi:hypothetical protein